MNSLPRLLPAIMMILTLSSARAGTNHEADPPSLELLEFLAAWETEDEPRSEWTGPAQFEDDDFDQLYDPDDLDDPEEDDPDD